MNYSGNSISSINPKFESVMKTELKMKGISFSETLAGKVFDKTKTMTRRPDKSGAKVVRWNPVVLNGHGGWSDDHGKPVKAPCKVGDLIYVREVHYVYGEWVKNGMSKLGKQKWKFTPIDGFPVLFERPDDVKSNTYRKPGWYKRIPMFMLKKYARTIRRVTEVTIEPLMDISEEDAIAEGVECFNHRYRDYSIPEEENQGYNYFISAKKSFFSLWDSIYGKDSHKQNPLTWVIKLEPFEE